MHSNNLLSTLADPSTWVTLTLVILGLLILTAIINRLIRMSCGIDVFSVPTEEMRKEFFDVAREFIDLEKKHGVDAVFDPCSLAEQLGFSVVGSDDCGGCPLYSEDVEDGCNLSLIGIEECSMLPDSDPKESM
jgi:hypothetical protein